MAAQPGPQHRRGPGRRCPRTPARSAWRDRSASRGPEPIGREPPAQRRPATARCLAIVARVSGSVRAVLPPSHRRVAASGPPRRRSQRLAEHPAPACPAAAGARPSHPAAEATARRSRLLESPARRSRSSGGRTVPGVSGWPGAAVRRWRSGGRGRPPSWTRSRRTARRAGRPPPGPAPRAPPSPRSRSKPPPEPPPGPPAR